MIAWVVAVRTLSDSRVFGLAGLSGRLLAVPAAFA